MYILMTIIIMVIALSWWFIIFTMRKNAGNNSLKESSWIYLVNELENMSNSWNTQEQLDDYLHSINPHVRNFETDYSFLLAYNSTIRQIRERLTP